MSSIQSTALNAVYYDYNRDKNLLQNLTGESSASDTSSFLNGITSLNSYVTGNLSSVKSDTDKTTDVLKKDYRLPNLGNALNAIGNAASFRSISNLNDYATRLLEYSQSKGYAPVNQSTSLTGVSPTGTNLMQYAINAYKSSTVWNKLQTGSFDMEV